MKRFLKRLLAYLFALFLLCGIFHYPETTDGPLALQLGYYAVTLGIPALLWVLVLEWLYRILRWARILNRSIEHSESAASDALDTKPLDRK
jgi:hypothetical protein